MSLRKQMILYFSCLMIVIFALTELVNGCQTYQLLKTNMISSILGSLNLGIKNIDLYFQDAGNVCSSIMADEKVQGILDGTISDDLNGKTLIRELNKDTVKYSSTRPYIIKVYLLNREHQLLNPDVKGVNVEPYINIVNNNGFLNISSLHQAGYITSGGKVFSLVKPIYRYNDRENQIGTIVADIDYKAFDDILRDYSIPLNGIILLSNESDQPLFCKNMSKSVWGNEEADFAEILAGGEEGITEAYGKNYIHIRTVSELTGWQLEAMIPRTEFIKSVFMQMKLSLFLLGICLVIIVLVSRKIILSVTYPLNLLAGSMKEIEKGNFSTTVAYDRQDEFSALIHGYNIMVVKIRELLQELVEKEKVRRDAELYALQAQINPHFLYNTLNSIRYFAKVYQAPEIRKMTASLISLSKASLSSEKFITIEKELELTRDYLEIQKMRYGEIVQTSYEVEEDVKDCVIPRFSIQPIVENALFHGILPVGEGEIRIQANEKDGHILIRIWDNGIGMSEEKIAGLNEELEKGIWSRKKDREISKLKNIGLENINYRIHMDFQNEHTELRIAAHNPGLEVCLWIPKRKEQKETNQDENSIDRG